MEELIVELEKEVQQMPSDKVATVLDFARYLNGARADKRHISSTVLLSMPALLEEWDTPEEDELWADL